ncbi:MAG: DUF177 domain-containing protein [Clostridia bacterium]|nr:DUF177 domain-containing protein [Clostridia bacterium]
MLLDISAVLKSSMEKLKFENEIDVNDVDFSEFDANFPESVKVSGNVKNVVGVVELSAHVDCTYATTCSRCGENITKNLSFDFEQTYVKEQTAEAEDALTLEGKTIDLKDIVCKNIVLELPLKQLCKEDCKGICQQCGTNLNHKQCDCKTEYFNPQFEILKGLFD